MNSEVDGQTLTQGVEVKEKHTYQLISHEHSLTIVEKGVTVDVLVNGHSYPFNSDEKEKNYTAEERKQFAENKKRNFYNSFLKNHFENLVVLTGAGTSVGYGGMTMVQLWDKVEEKLTPDIMKSFCQAVKHTEIENGQFDKNLEGLLSKAGRAKEFLTDEFDIAGKKTSIADVIKFCEAVIKDNCDFDLPEEAPHVLFLNKLVNRKVKDPRVKLFTLNYDTLYEQAAIAGNFTVIDGFSYSHPRTLSGRNFDIDIVYRQKSRIKEEESFVPKVFHLYKPHGSINWELDKGKVVIKEKTENPLMIFPKDSKYESSYEQPYFEMMSRFQQNLRNDNVLLICTGFSFNDKHIVTAIQEAVTQNPSFRLLIIMRTIKVTDEMKWFVEKAKSQQNVIIVAEDFNNFVKYFPSSQIYANSINPQ